MALQQNVLFITNSSDRQVENPNVALLGVIHNPNPNDRQKIRTTGQIIQISTKSKTQADRKIQETRQKIRTITQEPKRASAQKRMECNTNKTSQQVSENTAYKGKHK